MTPPKVDHRRRIAVALAAAALVVAVVASVASFTAVDTLATAEDRRAIAFVAELDLDRAIVAVAADGPEPELEDAVRRHADRLADAAGDEASITVDEVVDRVVQAGASADERDRSSVVNAVDDLARDARRASGRHVDGGRESVGLRLGLAVGGWATATLALLFVVRRETAV